MRIMSCCCALAGTSACENCNRYKEYGFTWNEPKIVSIPYTVVDDGSERRLQEIENAIKRLNERIDEVLEEQ